MSNRYNVRGLPTFKFFLGGKNVHEFSGTGEGQLRQFTQNVVSQAEFENVMLSMEEMTDQEKDASKGGEDVAKVYKKCMDQIKGANPDKLCVGAVAKNLVKSLRKKYGDGRRPPWNSGSSPRNPRKIAKPTATANSSKNLAAEPVSPTSTLQPRSS